MIDRRVALKHMAWAVGSVVALPAWANGWNPASVPPVEPFLSPRQAASLADIAETLIPASDTPGARALGVPAFIQKMLEDCYETDVQEAVKNGLNAVEVMANDRYDKPFAACDAAQRLALLATLETATEPDRKAFFTLLRNLTIQGYTTSEYVMTQHLHYVMIPGHYYGCVSAPVATK